MATCRAPGGPPFGQRAQRFVVIPAPLDSRFDRDYLLAAAQATPASAIEVSIVPARIDVYGAREPNVAWAVDRKARPNCKPEV